jgi:hypothetical protein
MNLFISIKGYFKVYLGTEISNLKLEKIYLIKDLKFL